MIVQAVTIVKHAAYNENTMSNDIAVIGNTDHYYHKYLIIVLESCLFSQNQLPLSPHCSGCHFLATAFILHKKFSNKLK